LEVSSLKVIACEAENKLLGYFKILKEWVNKMIKVIPDHKPFVTKVLKSLILPIAMFALAGCAGDNDSSAENENVSSASFQIPDSILANRLDQAAGTLTATLSVDDDVQETVTITGGATTVSFATLNNIPTGDREFKILFTYNLAPYGPLDVAEAIRTINITEGSNSPINFVDGDFDTASFDEDGDGISNLLELDENSTSDPTVEICRIGTDVNDSSALDNCELG